MDKQGLVVQIFNKVIFWPQGTFNGLKGFGDDPGRDGSSGGFDGTSEFVGLTAAERDFRR